MVQDFVPRLSNVHRCLLVALSLSAAAGWGSYAIVRHTSAAVEHQLRDQTTSLQAAQTQLVAEQMKAQVSLSEMVQLRGELATARREINRLSQGREQILTDLPPVRPDIKGTNLRLSDANHDASRTGSIGERTGTAQKDKAASAKLLEKQPRHPQIATVGITAPGPQKPAVRPQRSKDLTVISELDTAALRQLTKSAETPLR
ncbi:hypothetical protein [Microvirga sp. VF16]|uniref:hypothetical protein n=1 Tax=Microvirga sp. VF16 TaxID=2807101 RepID=UPI00193E3F27|nr:hypothetical protein [Microvirga sp. VF16]QRM34113.1 hypothetical protein JO965_33150 [Microvirga sp. VF16]